MRKKNILEEINIITIMELMSCCGYYYFYWTFPDWTMISMECSPGLERCSQVLLANRPKTEALQGTVAAPAGLLWDALQIHRFWPSVVFATMWDLVDYILNLVPSAPNCRKPPLITHQSPLCLSDLNSPLALPVLVFGLILPLAKYPLIFPAEASRIGCFYMELFMPSMFFWK